MTLSYCAVNFYSILASAQRCSCGCPQEGEAKGGQRHPGCSHEGQTHPLTFTLQSILWNRPSFHSWASFLGPPRVWRVKEEGGPGTFIFTWETFTVHELWSRESKVTGTFCKVCSNVQRYPCNFLQTTSWMHTFNSWFSKVTHRFTYTYIYILSALWMVASIHCMHSSLNSNCHPTRWQLEKLFQKNLFLCRLWRRKGQTSMWYKRSLLTCRHSLRRTHERSSS